jgi:hypothetical protein
MHNVGACSPECKYIGGAIFKPPLPGFYETELLVKKVQIPMKALRVKARRSIARKSRPHELYWLRAHSLSATFDPGVHKLTPKPKQV